MVDSSKKRKAPDAPPPGLSQSHKGSYASDDYTQLSQQDSAIGREFGGVNYRLSSENLSRTSSQWSIDEDHLLTTSFSAITMKSREDVFEETSISENFFTPKAPTPNQVGNEFVSGSLSKKSQRAPSLPSLTVVKEVAPRVTEERSSSDKNSVDTNCIVRGDEQMSNLEIPPVKATQESAPLGAVQHSSHTAASTPALASAPQKASAMQNSMEPEGQSRSYLTEDQLKQARLSLKSIPRQKVATLPLRKVDEENRPTVLSSCGNKFDIHHVAVCVCGPDHLGLILVDRSEKKDWNAPLCFRDRRSGVLKFMISEK
ncbi:conserved hypothetical protein [Echinococcus multilocularis]|uniref:Uncharacterized protein n=1 Tax=Echinococcus multilocularis TaxID=6211 RepID=A0A068YBK2_ECHMU|nr:conserved hypothetical protein [Echinococcus multilocularis]